MRTNFTLALAAIALSLGTVAASAASPDESQLAPSSGVQAARVPDPSLGHFGAGLKAIKSQQGSSLKDDQASGLAVAPTSRDAHLMPEGGQAWKHGLASASALASLAPASKEASREALTPPPGTTGAKQGFSAIKAGAGRHSASLMGGDQSILRRSPSDLQRPEGSNWSNGVNSIRTRR